MKSSGLSGVGAGAGTGTGAGGRQGTQASVSYYPSLETITPVEELRLGTKRVLYTSAAPVQLVPDMATFNVNGVRFVAGILEVCEIFGRSGVWCVVRNQAMLDSSNQKDILFSRECLAHVSVPGGRASEGGGGELSGGAAGPGAGGDEKANYLAVLYFMDTPRCLNLVFQSERDRTAFARSVLGVRGLCGGGEGDNAADTIRARAAAEDMGPRAPGGSNLGPHKSELSKDARDARDRARSQGSVSSSTEETTSYST